jgi:hypothetical protein
MTPTFYFSVKANMKGDRFSLVTVHVIHDSSKVSKCFTVSKKRTYAPFVFAEAADTDTTYVDMLKQLLCPQLEEDFPVQLQ